MHGHGKSRPSAVAGSFYPADGEALGQAVDGYLASAKADLPEDAAPPKALIAPHAGYVYSGALAAKAYAAVAARAEEITRVVLLGPAHRVHFKGMAVPSAEIFQSPLGPVKIDREATSRVLALPEVAERDDAHAEEHALEVQLPFLQRVLGDFQLLPIVVGEATADAVAKLLETLWGGPETLIVISSDLSHYLDYESAKKSDSRTRQAIESLDPSQIQSAGACGSRPIHGLLKVAQLKDLRATTIGVCNSGDTAGPRDRVVGYGAWSFTEAEATRTTEKARQTLLIVAARSIRNGLARSRRPQIKIGTFSYEEEAWRGSFITLKLANKLRGCIGSIQARMPLVADVAWNAYSAAFEDPRFKKLSKAEFSELEISISILGAAGELGFETENDLIRQLRPGTDGLILNSGSKRGVFLPQVWDQAAGPADFLIKLKQKAGLAATFWSDDIKIQRFTTETFSSRLVKPA